MVPNFRGQEPRLEGSKTRPRPRLCVPRPRPRPKLSLKTSRDQNLSLENYTA